MATRRRTFDTDRYLEVIDAIYAAITDEHAWNRALSLIAEATDTRTAVIMASDPMGGRADALWTSSGAAEQYRELYNSRFAELNIYAAAAPPRLGVGQLYVSEDFVPAREARRTAFYEEFMQPLGVLHNMGCLLNAEPSFVAFLTCARREGKTMFSHAETQLLVKITPHLQRALGIARRLQTVALERATAQSALDRLSVGLVLLDRRGVPIYLNRAAECILARNDGLRASKTGIAAAHPSESRRLQSIVRSACTLSATVETPAGGALAITRPSRRQPFGVLVSPIRLAEFPLASRQPVAALVITDPESSTPDVSSILIQLFGLTPSRSRAPVAGAVRPRRPNAPAMNAQGSFPFDSSPLFGARMRFRVCRADSRSAASNRFARRLLPSRYIVAFRVHSDRRCDPGHRRRRGWSSDGT